MIHYIIKCQVNPCSILKDLYLFIQMQYGFSLGHGISNLQTYHKISFFDNQQIDQK